MAENFSQLPPNSSGEKIRLFENTVGPNDVNSEAMTLTDQTGQVMANMGASGRLKVDASEVVVPVSDNGGSLTVDGTVTATLPSNSGVDIGDVTVNNTGGASAVNIQDGGNSITVDGTVTANAGTGPWPVTDNGGSLTVDGSVTANPTRPATSATSTVATSTTSAQLLASNANRLGATIHNDGNQNLFVKLGTTASTTDFTIRMASQAYYEVPFGYTGRIDAVQSTGTGNARITELTA